MMMGDVRPVNGREGDIACGVRGPQKKAGLEEPGLRYWPREADTITFQEGLLNVRATGGGGQMRNPNVQRAGIMIRVRALQRRACSVIPLGR